MKPIINPWIFYFADVANTMVFVFMFMGIAFFVYAFYKFMTLEEDEYIMNPDYFYTLKEKDKDAKKKDWHIIKRYVLIGCAFIILATLTPTEKTIYRMTIASYITEDNLSKGKEEAKELIDYIVEKMDEIEETDSVDKDD